MSPRAGACGWLGSLRLRLSAREACGRLRPRMKRVLVLGLVGFLATACAVASTDEAVGGTPRFDPTPPRATSTDPTFTALYRDFFGPGAPASCAGSSCHAPGGGGAFAFTCSVDQAACAASAAAIATNEPTFRASTLYRLLRKADGSGRMPDGSTFVFDEAALARIEAWVKNGAKND